MLILPQETAGHPDMLMHFISLLESGSIYPRTGQESIDSDKGTSCQSCGTSLEDECFGALNFKWHALCLSCHVCRAPILVEKAEGAFLDQKSGTIHCSTHAPEEAPRVRKISQLEQYSSLLVLALKRMCQLIQVPYPRASFTLLSSF